MRTSKLLLWTLWLAIGPTLLLAAATPFVGTFKGDDLTFTSQLESTGGHKGTIGLGAETFPFTARLSGKTLRGQFTTPDGVFAFEATGGEGTLTLTTDDATYALKRQTANPLAAKRAPASAPVTAAVGTAENAPIVTAQLALPMKYTHSSGFSFAYPKDWRIDESQAAGGVLLLQPAGAQAQQETYLVSGADSGGIASATDPRVEQLLEQFVAQMAPGFQRTGKAESVPAGERAGVSLVWEGAGPTGAPMRLRVYTTILNNAIVSLTAVGEKPRLAAREGQLREIFATFDLGTSAVATPGAGGGGGNPAELVGTWKNWEYKSYGGSSSSEKTTFITLAADGSYGVSGNAESSHSFTFRDSGGAQTGNAGYASQGGGSEGGGRWQAANGVLTLTDATGSTSFNYQIRPNSSGWPILYATPVGGSKASEWTRVR